MKVCCILNIAPHYREALLREMDADPSVSFDLLAGEESHGGIALADTSGLKGFRGYLCNVYRRGGKLVWQKKAFSKAFSRKYDAYILTGNPGIRSNWLIALAARLTGRKVFLWTHGLRGDENGRELRKYMAWFRLSNHLLLYGERARELLLAQGYPAKRMTVIYNALDTNRQERVSERMGDSGFIRNFFGNDLPYVVFSSRLTAVKRIDLLIEAVGMLKCNLVMIGDGPLRDELQMQVERLELTDRVWFYGECYDETVLATFFRHSAACVSPGDVGLTALHAMGYGTPVITHDNPAHQMPEAEAVIPGRTGDLFREGDPVSLASAIERWLAVGEEERELVRQRCRELIESHYNPTAQLAAIRRALGMTAGANGTQFD